MECEEFYVDIRKTSLEERKEGQRQTQLLFQINHTMPFTEEYHRLLQELFRENLGKGSSITPPLSGACVGNMKIGKQACTDKRICLDRRRSYHTSRSMHWQTCDCRCWFCGNKRCPRLCCRSRQSC